MPTSLKTTKVSKDYIITSAKPSLFSMGVIFA
jgi:hypothetical protein